MDSAKRDKAAMLGMAMALGAMNMLAPSPVEYRRTKPTPPEAKPQRAKNKAQRAARKVTRRAK